MNIFYEEEYAFEIALHDRHGGRDGPFLLLNLYPGGTS